MREEVKEKKEKRKFELLSAFEAYKPFPPLSEQKQKERRGLLDSLLFQASFSLLSLFSLPLHARPCFELGRVVCVEGEAERAGRNEKREASKLSSSLPAGRSRKASLRTTASILPHFFEKKTKNSSSLELLFPSLLPLTGATESRRSMKRVREDGQGGSKRPAGCVMSFLVFFPLFSVPPPLLPPKKEKNDDDDALLFVASSAPPSLRAAARLAPRL
jgi:hypothetical protein